MPTAITRPAAALCRNCQGPGADPTRRWLCPACASDGAIRSCFSTDGRRVAEPVAERVEQSEYVEVPITLEAPYDGRQPAEPPPHSRPRRPRRCPTPTDPAARQAQQEADDAALLAAAEEVTRRGRHLIAGTCVPAAGTRAASLVALLPPAAAEAAVARLVEAGKVRRVTVVVTAAGRTGGRLAAGLQLKRRPVNHSGDNCDGERTNRPGPPDDHGGAARTCGAAGHAGS